MSCLVFGLRKSGCIKVNVSFDYMDTELLLTNFVKLRFYYFYLFCRATPECFLFDIHIFLRSKFFPPTKKKDYLKSVGGLGDLFAKDT